MSLINDALKRVQQQELRDAQSVAPPMSLAPVLTPAGRSGGVLKPAFIKLSVAILIGGAAFWTYRGGFTDVRAREASRQTLQIGAMPQPVQTLASVAPQNQASQTVTEKANPAPKPVLIAPAASGSGNRVAETKTSANVSARLEVPDAAAAVVAQPVAKPDVARNAAAPAAKVASPRPAPLIVKADTAVPRRSKAATDLKLQSIIAHPSRPMAVINGKTVFVGDIINNMRVTKITAEAATLAWGTNSRVLRVTRK